MRILITSQFFYPVIGGLNPIAHLSAREFIRRRHEVRLLTGSTGRFECEDEYPIIRRPEFRAMLEHYRWSDVVFQNHISIRFALPLTVVRRPYVVSMSGWVHPAAGASSARCSLRARFVSFALGVIVKRATRTIAACAAVAAGNRTPARIIPNPFDASAFRNERREGRSRDFLFAGRITSDKGVDDLIRAIAILRTNGRDAGAVIAGEGPEIESLTALARDLGVANRVTFVGPKRGRELMDLMNSHQVLVVPSKWNEPIGIVALEAIACGCAVIGTERGGLAVTIGPCGLTYPNGDHEALAARMIEVLNLDGRLDRFTDPAPRHLERYLPERVCGEYLEEIMKAAQPR